jgi:hypothetical protein
MRIKLLNIYQNMYTILVMLTLDQIFLPKLHVKCQI